MVRLSTAHIIIDAATAAALFGDVPQVSWVYLPDKKAIFITPGNNEDFKALYKTATSILKYRNGANDRSISVMELLIDHDISDADMALEYTADEKAKVLQVFF